MKNLISIILVFGVMLLAIPAVALYKKPAQTKDDSSSKIIKKDVKVESLKEPEVYKMLDTKTNTIFEIKPRDYVIGAVFAQMPANFEKEALKAQAIIAHTYILRQHETVIQNSLPDLMGADFSNNFNMYQAYFNAEQAKSLYGDEYNANLKKISEAVDEVMKKVVTYDGSLISPAFHSMSGGMTESAKNAWGTDLPYLQPVKSDGETKEKGFSESNTFSAEEISTRLKQDYKDIKLGEDKSQWLKVGDKSESGTVLTLTAGDKTIKGSDLKSILSLRSCNFEISFKDDTFTIVTKGVGHGVGFSQYGANAMAKSGSTYDKLLSYYYTGIKIEDLK